MQILNYWTKHDFLPWSAPFLIYTNFLITKINPFTISIQRISFRSSESKGRWRSDNVGRKSKQQRKQIRQQEKWRIVDPWRGEKDGRSRISWSFPPSFRGSFKFIARVLSAETCITRFQTLSLARGIEGKRDKPVEIIDLIEISRGGDIYIYRYV